MTVVSSRNEAPVTGGGCFASGGEFTVGAEEELLLVGADNLLHGDGTDELVRRLSASAARLGTVKPELFAAEIEFATTVCTGGDRAAERLQQLRAQLRDAGARALAVGVHPAGEFGDALLTPAARYDVIGHGLAGLLRTPTAALQVHVGLPDAASAVAAYRGMRHHLAVLRALSASSPFWHGRDSGFASARWAVISSYPRGGVPPAVATWEEYVALTEAVVAAAEAPDYTHVWWDVRIQPRIGTIEVRVMDAHPSLDLVAGLVALVQGLARRAVEQPLAVDVPSAVLAENDFRAARFGLNARLTDLDGTMLPARKLAARLVSRARDVLAPDGLDAPLDAVLRLLVEETEADRQRRLHADGGMAALLDELGRRTLGLG